MAFLSLLRPDRFTIALVATAVAATILPATGAAAPILKVVIVGSIALLFFLQGARLSRQAIIQGAIHWRLHLMVFAATFILFPVLGLLTKTYLQSYLAPGIALGILYLCLLPSTIQSSITFTSIAGGNVAAAVCSASASNVLGVLLTPLLMGMFMQTQGGVSFGAIGEIVLQILVPFLLGHLLRPWIGSWVETRRMLTSLVDRGAILLVVYYAFGEAAVEGLWQRLAPRDMIVLVVISCILLGLVLVTTTLASRLFGFSTRDEVAIVFCGSKKSLGSGVPIASILFPASMIGAIILPLMLFHQIQLLVCAVLARAYAKRTAQEPVPAE
ncbi:bile acid:sodium symporter [Microvirga sp. HBU67558]|uniref:bile acid:sodium symporter family protein n=1 Tax=Microvirga TaxID=186650 RepID=UPI001B384982|nr:MULTISPECIES: bile acid:sodium symporter family protein [unclassified Microvirga]MBQ0822000.1 bile acid:sodium symporter [Microvirga sp. HBU67558]